MYLTGMCGVQVNRPSKCCGLVYTHGGLKFDQNTLVNMHYHWCETGLYLCSYGESMISCESFSPLAGLR